MYYEAIIRLYLKETEPKKIIPIMEKICETISKNPEVRKVKNFGIKPVKNIQF